MKTTNIKIFVTAFFLVVFSASLLAQPDKKINDTDALGRKQGFWKKYVNDSLRYEGNFINDKPIGEFKYYYFQGKIKAVTQYSDSGRIAKTVMYFINGKKNAEGTYVDKKKDGLWVYYGINEFKISEESYKKGVRDGCWKYFYDDGKILKIENYKNNLLEGEWMDYYADSVPKIKANYVKNKLDGKYQYYFQSGKILYTGYYKNDLKDGEWMFFNENGLGERKLTYKKGDLVKEEIVVLSGGIVKFLDESSIAFCFSKDKETLIKLNSGEEVKTSYPINSMEILLDQFNFLRINPEYIVSVWSVKNRKTFDRENPVLVLNPDPGKQILVHKDKIAAFMSWAGIIKYE